MVCAAIVGIVLLSMTYKSYGKELPMYDDIKKNYIQTPLKKITLQESPCQAPLTRLFDFEWPGIKPFCSCWFTSSVGACSYKQSRNGCKTKGDIPPVPLSKYKGVYLCAEKTAYDYDGLTEVEPGRVCPDGLKACGTSTDSWNLCFPVSSDCPINDIVFSPTKRNDLKDQFYKEIEVSYSKSGSVLNFGEVVTQKASWFIYFTNAQITKPIIVQFSVGYKNQICIYPQEILAPTTPFKYLRNEEDFRKECTAIDSKTVDTRYVYLDTYNQYNFWTENSIVTQMNNLPDFDGQSLNYEFDIFQRGYLHLDAKCLYEGDTKIYSLKSQIMDVLSFNYMTSYNRKAFFISAIVLLVIAVIIGIVAMCTATEERTNCCNWITGFIVVAFVITAFALTIVMYIRGRQRGQDIDKIHAKNCGDELTNLAINQSYMNHRRDSIYFLSVIGVLGFGIILYLIYTCLKPCEKDTPRHHFSAELHGVNVDDKESNSVKRHDGKDYQSFDTRQDVGLYD
jgi:hypothetical protein